MEQRRTVTRQLRSAPVCPFCPMLLSREKFRAFTVAARANSVGSCPVLRDGTEVRL
jgi:hypothetical protein